MYFCIEPTCLKQAIYNHSGGKPMFCGLHADFEGGINYNPPMEERFEKLRELIQECISVQTKSGIFRLFYNE